MWATKEGQARWTLILDDATRRASPLHPPTTMTMRKDYHDIIALANDVGRKQGFMLYYGQICGSAAASFDAHGHDERFHTISPTTPFSARRTTTSKALSRQHGRLPPWTPT